MPQTPMHDTEWDKVTVRPRFFFLRPFEIRERLWVIVINPQLNQTHGGERVGQVWLQDHGFLRIGSCVLG